MQQLASLYPPLQTASYRPLEEADPGGSASVVERPLAWPEVAADASLGAPGRPPVRAASPVATLTGHPVERAVPPRPARTRSIRRRDCGPLKHMGVVNPTVQIQSQAI